MGTKTVERSNILSRLKSMEVDKRRRHVLTTELSYEEQVAIARHGTPADKTAMLGNPFGIKPVIIELLTNDREERVKQLARGRLSVMSHTTVRTGMFRFMRA